LDQLTTAEKGLAGGVLAAIVIAAVIAAIAFGFGGKKGYEVYQKYHKERAHRVENNPMYAEQMGRTDNPFYKDVEQ